MKTFSQFLAESQQEFVGIHYGKVGGLHQLVGGMYGTGIRGNVLSAPNGKEAFHYAGIGSTFVNSAR